MIAILRYNAGNARSVSNALQRLGVEPVVTDDHDTLRAADKVIFPGVGEASSAMRHLRERGLDVLLKELTQPVLGICLGMQLMCAHSEENDTEGLGIFPNSVRRFPPRGKVPHTGWNGLSRILKPTPLFDGIAEHEDVYYVHSYYADIGDDTAAESHHILPFSAALQRGNVHGVQFHPEKSAATGAKVLANFLNLKRES